METAGSTRHPAPPAPGGGISLQDPCGWRRSKRFQRPLGSDVVTAEANTTDATTTYCNYESEDGTVGMEVSFSRGQTFIFASYASSGGAIPVPGVGDGAVVTSQGVRFIKRGDTVVGIQPLTEFDSPQEMISAFSDSSRQSPRDCSSHFSARRSGNGSGQLLRRGPRRPSTPRCLAERASRACVRCQSAGLRD